MNAPFELNGGRIGESAAVINEGRFNWVNGTIEGEGLTNRNRTFFFGFKIAGIGRRVIASTLRNDGHIRQIDGAAISLGSGAELRIGPDGIYEIDASSSITLESGAADALIENEGTFQKTATSPSQTSTISPNYHTTAKTEVRDGTLRFLSSSNVFDGAHIVAMGSDSRLLLGGLSTTSTSLLKSSTVTLVNGGKLEWTSGTHSLEGTLTSMGSGEMVLTGGILRVESDRFATLETASTAPLVLNGSRDSTFLEVQADADLYNDGTVHWLQTTLHGPSALTNRGTIQVIGIATISNGTDGTLKNDKTITNAGTVQIGDNGLLDNRSLGAFDFTAHNTFVRPRSEATEGAEFINSGTVKKSAGTGTSAITTEFTQTGGELLSEMGTLSLRGPTSLLGGKVSSTNKNSTGSKVEISGPSLTGNVVFNFAAGGIVEYHTADHILNGPLSGSGEGRLRHTGGAMTVATNEGSRLSFDSGALFEQAGGTIGGKGLLTNTGSFEQTGGTVIGPFRNEANYDWRSGTISGSLLNTGKAAKLRIFGNGPVDLADDAALDNLSDGNIVQLTNTILEVGSNVKIKNQKGATYEVQGDNGRIRHRSGADGAQFRNEGLFEHTVVNDAADNFHVEIPFLNQEGQIKASSTVLRFVGPTDLRGGQVISSSDASISFIGPTNVDDVRFEAGSSNEFREAVELSPIDVTQIVTFNGRITGDGQGRTIARAFKIESGKVATFDFRRTSPFVIDTVFQIRIEGQLQNAGTLIVRSARSFTGDTTTITATANGVINAGRLIARSTRFNCPNYSAAGHGTPPLCSTMAHCP